MWWTEQAAVEPFRRYHLRGGDVRRYFGDHFSLDGADREASKVVPAGIGVALGIGEHPAPGGNFTPVELLLEDLDAIPVHFLWNIHVENTLSPEDDLALALDEAKTESPGGPRAKQLRIRFQDQGLDELVGKLLEEWGDMNE